MTIGQISWNKIIAISSAFGIPLLSLIIMIAVWGTRIDDHLTDVQITQVKQGNDIQDLRGEMKQMHRQIDTISLKQHDADFIYQKKTDEKITGRSAYYASFKNFTEKWIYVDGVKTLIFIPVK